jgi:hypothetical protein
MILLALLPTHGPVPTTTSALDPGHPPPALLIPRVQARLRGLRRLHTGRVNLTQRRQLLVAGGWLATLLATLQFDAGDQPAAEDSRDAALQLGKAAGPPGDHGLVV